MSNGAFQLLGMADLGLLPTIFSHRDAHTGTPWVAIAASTVITIVISFLGFDDVIATANFMYGLGTLLEFASFLWLRARHLALKRPYRVPLSVPALVAMCIVPLSFLAYMCVVAPWRVFAIAAGLTTLGVGWHSVMRMCRVKKLLSFDNV